MPTCFPLEFDGVFSLSQKFYINILHIREHLYSIIRNKSFVSINTAHSLELKKVIFCLLLIVAKELICFCFVKGRRKNRHECSILGQILLT